MSESDLEKLDSLRQRGVLSEQAFWDARSRLGTAPSSGPPPNVQPWQAPGYASWDEPVARWNTAPADWTAPPPRVGRSSKRFRRRPLLVAGLLALLVVAGGTAYALTRQGAGTTMRVSFALTDEATAKAGCVGQGDDAAFRAGDPVTLYGPGDRRLAVVSLDAGVRQGGRCSFGAIFRDFKTTYDAYTVAIAHGPTRHVERADLRADGWRVDVTGGPPTRQFNGNLTLHDPSTYDNGCIAFGIYSDLNNRPPVVVEDKAGRVIGSGRLAAATVGPGASCEYDFVVNNVRDDESVYTVDVAHIAHLTQTRSTLADNAWSFVLELVR